MWTWSDWFDCFSDLDIGVDGLDKIEWLGLEK